ncbi:epimerase [Variovorax sp. WS11]|uniref:SDR family oxidoreductase n=1 Tax=Variovorax sp. WS11 TaxID=1105204 RepID=UPI000D0CAD20|nr:NAD(P)H-binding protein [Variovorax sp. WS11]NDZ13616.1 NAD(P)H-binding protein [Variovorax sp. WS11]PSL79623.1 epimerase [Variovorax sp. WS11]
MSNKETGLTLVTGGTGHLGRDLVQQLLAAGRRVRVLARQPGSDARIDWARGDLSNGDGLRDALDGVTTVINAATFSPIAQRGYVRLIDLFRTPRAVDVDGTRHLLQESERAGVEHFVHVSIVGLDPKNSLPYNRVKLAGENLVRQSDLPWSIVRAAPFHYLMACLLRSMRWLPWWPLPNSVMQPVATTDVAAYLIRCADSPDRGMHDEIGGPEAKPFPVFAQQYLDIRGLRRRLIRLDISEEKARRMGFVAANGCKGSVTWRDWLLGHADEPKGKVRNTPIPPHM